MPQEAYYRPLEKGGEITKAVAIKRKNFYKKSRRVDIWVDKSGNLRDRRNVKPLQRKGLTRVDIG